MEEIAVVVAAVCSLCYRGGSGGGLLCTDGPFHDREAAGWGCVQSNGCGSVRGSVVMTCKL